MEMVHECQGLALRLEPGKDVARIHAELDQFERYLAADRPELLGEISRAHPPFANPLADLVTIGDDGVDQVRPSCVG